MTTSINGWQVELQAIEGDAERAAVQVYRYGVPVGYVYLATDPQLVGEIKAEPIKD